MRAILRTAFGAPEVLVIREIPEPKDGHAVIEVKAFGLNHAELHMRQGNWAEIADVRDNLMKGAGSRAGGDRRSGGRASWHFKCSRSRVTRNLNRFTRRVSTTTKKERAT